jgi:hypothetical protein
MLYLLILWLADLLCQRRKSILNRCKWKILSCHTDGTYYNPTPC